MKKKGSTNTFSVLYFFHHFVRVTFKGLYICTNLNASLQAVHSKQLVLPGPGSGGGGGGDAEEGNTRAQKEQQRSPCRSSSRRGNPARTLARN